MRLGRLEQLEPQLRPEGWLGLFAMLLLLTGLAGALYVLKPAWKELQDLSSEELSIDMEALRSVLASNDDTIAILEAETDVLQKQLYGASAHLPSEQMEAWVIGALDRISRNHGVQLLSVEPGQGDAVMMFEELPYEVDVAGGYFSLYEWLNSVERELRPMVIKQFEIDRSAGDARVRMRLRLVAYRPGEASA